MKLRQRAFYYMAIYADPTNPQVAYAPEVDGVFKTNDGGKTLTELDAAARRQSHHLDQSAPSEHLAGRQRRRRHRLGRRRRELEHRAQSADRPVLSRRARRSVSVPRLRRVAGRRRVRRSERRDRRPGIGLGDWHTVALGESTFVAPDPGNPHVTYGSGYYSSFVRLDRITGEEKNVSPWPRYMAGASAAETKYRFGWTHPIFFSPADPHELLVAAQVVFSSIDHGQTWKIISPDLTRNDPTHRRADRRPGRSRSDRRRNVPRHRVARGLAARRERHLGRIGRRSGARDEGSRRALDRSSRRRIFRSGRRSARSSRRIRRRARRISRRRAIMWDDYHPYVYETTDYGAHWTPMTSGLPADQYVFVVRQDPREPRLLFAGTRSTVYVSLDGGAQWQPLDAESAGRAGTRPRDRRCARASSSPPRTAARFGFSTTSRCCEQLAHAELAVALRACSSSRPRRRGFRTRTASASFSIPEFGDNPAYGAAVFFNVPPGYNGKTPLTLSLPRCRRRDGSQLHAAPEESAREKTDSRARG